MKDNKTDDKQRTRPLKLPELIERYNFLINEILETANDELPSFEDVTDNNGEVKKTREEQIYDYVEKRMEALDDANKMLKTVNELESELNPSETVTQTVNHAKKYAKK